MEREWSARLWLAAVTTADGAALFALFPHWRTLASELAAPHRWLARVGANHAALTLAGTALWCVALWLAVALGFAGCAALPGRVGALCRAVAARLLPAVLIRAVAGVTGVSVLLSPVAATATTPANPAVAAGPAVAAVPAVAPGPAVAAVPAFAPSSAGAAAIPAPGWPLDPSAPGPPGAATPPGPPSAAGAPATGGTDVRVQPGDSLWLIAARRLGRGASDAEIADAWPRWYAANARVIGDDPALLRPGEVLHVPDDASAPVPRATTASNATSGSEETRPT